MASWCEVNAGTVRVGPLALSWRDLWTRRWGIAVEWGNRSLIDWGFGT